MRFLLSRHARKEFENLSELPNSRKVFASRSVVDGQAVVSVCRDEDGSWQFFSELDKSHLEGPVLLHFEHIPGRDELVRSVPALKKDHWALYKSEDQTWEIVQD